MWRKQKLFGGGTASLALFLTVALLVVATAGAQYDKKGEAELRTVHGNVVDKNELPVPSSVVYLLNVKTEAVRTYIADQAGIYRFSGLDPNVDYEIHAEHDGLISPTRTVSSFSSQKNIDVTLKLSIKKKEH